MRYAPKGIEIDASGHSDVLSFNLPPERLLMTRDGVYFSELDSTDVLTEEGRTLAEGILAVDGVQDITISGRGISVFRSKAHSWAAIEPKVLRILLDDPAYGEDVPVPPKLVVVSYPNPQRLAFHTTARITLPRRVWLDPGEAPAGSIAESIVAELRAIGGITPTTLRPHQIDVDFTGLLPDAVIGIVMGILKRPFGDAEVQVERQRIEPERPSPGIGFGSRGYERRLGEEE